MDLKTIIHGSRNINQMNIRREVASPGRIWQKGAWPEGDFCTRQNAEKHFPKNLNRPSGFHFACLKLGKQTEKADICFLAVTDTTFPVSLPVCVQLQRHWEPVAYTLLGLCFQAHRCPVHGRPGGLVTLQGNQCHLHCWSSESGS